MISPYPPSLREPISVFFRVDCTIVTGSGHIVRCLALAAHFHRYNAKISFISAAPLPQHIHDNHPEYVFYSFPDADPLDDSLANESIAAADDGPELAHDHFRTFSQLYDANSSQSIIEKNRCDILIVDHYGLDSRWEEKLRHCAGKLVVIDDLADRYHSCDFLIDQSRRATRESDYTLLLAPSTVRLIGPKYALLRPDFIISPDERNIRTRIENLFVFFGSFDADNFTAVTLNVLSKTTWRDKNITIVIGAQNPHAENVAELAAAMTAKVIVQTKQMGALMMAADIAIGAAGSASWERAATGLPSLVASVASNQDAVLDTLVSHGSAIALPTKKDEYAAALPDAINVIETCKDLIETMSKKSYELRDGKGIERIVTQIMKT